MTNKRSFVLGLFITASLLCTSRTAWGNSEINTYTKTDFAMDTVVSETLYTTGEDITADVISALKDVEENGISCKGGVQRRDSAFCPSSGNLPSRKEFI